MGPNTLRSEWVPSLKYGFDVDGVLADFNYSYQALIVKQTGMDLFCYSEGFPDCWDYPERYGYKKEDVNAAWETIKESRDFWETLYSLPDRDHLGPALDLESDVYFVTNRPGYRAKAQTENWLRQYGIRRPTVLLSSMKGFCALALDLDFYIDDKLENANDVAAMSRANTYLLDRPYNQGATKTGVTRVSSLRRAFEDFKDKREPWGKG